MKARLVRAGVMLVSLSFFLTACSHQASRIGRISSAGPGPDAAKAAPAKPKPKPVPVLKPIRALLVTGGCCHDYDSQKRILSEGISARAHVEFTIVHQGGTSTESKIPLYDNPNWAKGYDVVVHNECFARVRDKNWLERILKPHREGVPAVLIHCAMHCYRIKGDDWFKFAGLTSRGHGKKYSIDVVNLDPTHPIMQDFGKTWKTPKGELYLVKKIWPTAHPLAQALSRDTNKNETCIWTNTFGQTRVFGTTIGHHNETMRDPVYLDLVTRGLLWSAGKLGDKRYIKERAAVPGGQNKKEVGATDTPGLVRKNLALGKKASASATQRGNESHKAVDGDLATRWCAVNDQAGHWWQVDLGRPQDLTGCRITLELYGRNYRYRVEGSADSKAWTLLVDANDPKVHSQVRKHEFKATGIRYLRVTSTKLRKGTRMSFREFAVLGTELIDASEAAVAMAPGHKPGELLKGVKAPPQFDVSLFAAPPNVSYPTCIAAAPSGEVFVGVDPNGSLDKVPGRGSVVRCIDEDGDGVADRFTTFARLDYPRGLFYDNNMLWVLHPPRLSVYYDDNGDGVADRSDILIKGISTQKVFSRGADHTTNGIRMGIDGWLYIAVGDFGFYEAEGTDGRTLSLLGGGIARVRPDGTELEIYARGIRNIYDMAIDPLLNVFTRDNTNDGGGWDTRLSFVVQGGQSGYPSLFKNYKEEIIEPLADYGGGSGTGAMFLSEPSFPAPYDNALLTCDWGTSKVYYHPLKPKGATFEAEQQVFVSIDRPTDIDADASGRLYIASWRGGKFKYRGPNVGYVARLTPKGHRPQPFPDLKRASDGELLKLLASLSHTRRLYAQREILRRGSISMPALVRGVERLARVGVNVPVRVAAIFTLKQLLGAKATPTLVRLARAQNGAAVKEFVLRALTDRKGELSGVPTSMFVQALKDLNPRVRAQAAISLGRLGRERQQESAEAVAVAIALIPLTADPDPIVAHAAVNSLVELRAVEACLNGIRKTSTPKAALGALRVLRRLHDERTVNGLEAELRASRNGRGRVANDVRQAIITALIRLYHREGEWKGSWWGTRPDTTGPYFKRVKWQQTPAVEKILRREIERASGNANANADGNEDALRSIMTQMDQHRVTFDNLPPRAAAIVKAFTDKREAEKKRRKKEKAKAKLQAPKQQKKGRVIGNMKLEEIVSAVTRLKGDAQRGEKIFQQSGCVACHTTSPNESPRGPYLGDVAARYSRKELIESIVRPSASIAQGFAAYTFQTRQGKTYLGFIVREAGDEVEIADIAGNTTVIRQQDITARSKLNMSMMPGGLLNNRPPEELASVLAYLERLAEKGSK